MGKINGFLLVPLLPLLISCGDKSLPFDCSDEYYKCSYIYHEHLSTLLLAGELTFFFDEYQDIRSDRDAAEKLLESYFNGMDCHKELFYETCCLDHMGRVSLVSDGKYYLETNVWPTFTLDVEMGPDGTLVFSEDGEQFISLDHYTARKEGMSIVSDFDYSYDDLDGTRIRVRTVDGHPFRKAVPDGLTYYTPSTGKLEIDYGSEVWYLTFDGPDMHYDCGTYKGVTEAFSFSSNYKLYKFYK